MSRLALTEQGFERMVEKANRCADVRGGCDDCPSLEGCVGLWSLIINFTKEIRDGKETYFIDR